MRLREPGIALFATAAAHIHNRLEEILVCLESGNLLKDAIVAHLFVMISFTSISLMTMEIMCFFGFLFYMTNKRSKICNRVAIVPRYLCTCHEEKVQTLEYAYERPICRSV